MRGMTRIGGSPLEGQSVESCQSVLFLGEADEPGRVSTPDAWDDSDRHLPSPVGVSAKVCERTMRGIGRIKIRSLLPIRGSMTRQQRMRRMARIGSSPPHTTGMSGGLSVYETQVVSWGGEEADLISHTLV